MTFSKFGDRLLEAFVNYGFIFGVTTTISLCCWGAQDGRVYPMVSTKATGFRKSETCPSSNELLDFQDGDLAVKRRTEVTSHIDRCEFCAAELELYSRYPQQADEAELFESVAIPGPLFQLAEALLKKKHNDPSSLDFFLSEPPAVAGG